MCVYIFFNKNKISNHTLKMEINFLHTKIFFEK